MVDNLNGARFNRWTVVEPLSDSTSPRMVDAICDCGKRKTVRLDYLKAGRSKSCGCLRNEKSRERMTVHGMRSSSIYRVWMGMIQRCTNPKMSNYNRYGGRGIAVCERWLVASNFIEDMSPRPSGTSIDRIDNSLGYFKENCRWATPVEQGRNARHVKLSLEIVCEMRRLRACGETISDIAMKFNISRTHVWEVVNHKQWEASK